MVNAPIVVFEKIKRLTDSQKEYWSARELAKTLGYTDYRNFELVVNKAIEACKNSGQSTKNHFVDVTDMVSIGSGASRVVNDTLLTRYACYLVMQNADPSKEIVALGVKNYGVFTNYGYKGLYGGLTMQDIHRPVFRYLTVSTRPRQE